MTAKRDFFSSIYSHLQHYYNGIKWTLLFYVGKVYKIEKLLSFAAGGRCRDSRTVGEEIQPSTRMCVTFSWLHCCGSIFVR